VPRVLLSVILFGIVAAMPAGAGAEMPPELGAIEGRVIWVDFWASWCAPCRRSFPWLNAMHKEYSVEGLQIIGVNVDKERALAMEFLNETPAEFVIRFDPAGDIAERFDVQAMPSSFLLDESGNILARHYGFKLANSDEYEQSIRTALGKASNQQTERSDLDE